MKIVQVIKVVFLTFCVLNFVRAMTYVVPIVFHDVISVRDALLMVVMGSEALASVLVPVLIRDACRSYTAVRFGPLALLQRFRCMRETQDRLLFEIFERERQQKELGNRLTDAISEPTKQEKPCFDEVAAMRERKRQQRQKES
jgi:hypothetical protein